MFMFIFIYVLILARGHSGDYCLTYIPHFTDRVGPSALSPQCKGNPRLASRYYLMVESRCLDSHMGTQHREMTVMKLYRYYDDIRQYPIDALLPVFSLQ